MKREGVALVVMRVECAREMREDEWEANCYDYEQIKGRGIRADGPSEVSLKTQ